MSLDEFGLIRRFFEPLATGPAQPGVDLGIGDDCALLGLAPGQQLAVSTDTLVEGVHFPLRAAPVLLGRRAVAVCASDLAAMGADPLAFTLALTLPSADSEWLTSFAQGLADMARTCGLTLVGGDTTRGPLTLTLSVFGSLPIGQALRRNGARPGDYVCVGGTLGEAAAALPRVLNPAYPLPPALAARLLDRYWAPLPQFELGRHLRRCASSALDISDGLVGDAAHIAQASGVKVVIELERLPILEALYAHCGEQARAYALSGGDDYRLLFTLPPSAWASLQAQYPDICLIGRVEAGTGVLVLDSTGREVAVAGGYQHF